jgi:glycogen(starch) synthase
MRVAMLSWEFPPLLVGGISPHVEGLSAALVRAGHDVVVLTLHHPDAPDDAVVNGVRVLRAHHDLPWLPEDNFLARMASTNHQLVQLVARLGDWRPDVVHAHDWLVAWAGDTLRALVAAPLVATIHATERGRNGGHVPAYGQPAGINATEWWLTYQARDVICCSGFMVDEVIGAFGLPPSKVHMVPNGVDAALWAPPTPAPARGGDGPLLVTWGRVQFEKGFHTAIEAIAHLRVDMPSVRLVVAGRGSYLADLQELAGRLGVSDAVHFAGFVPDDDLRAMLHRASAAIIPSLYEPFGIVALEALAAGAPLVAASTGGLAEILEGTGAAQMFPAGDAGALADRLRTLLTDPALAAASSAAGTALVHDRYGWDAIAAATVSVYEAQLPAVAP